MHPRQIECIDGPLIGACHELQSGDVPEIVFVHDKDGKPYRYLVDRAINKATYTGAKGSGDEALV